MKATLFATFVALLMAGCGEGQNPGDSNADNDSVSAPFVDKWAEWEANPEPYGGPEVLAKIKKAKESGAISLLFQYNQISDLSPLTGLTKLRELRLGDNEISDVSPLKGLTKLETLYLSVNNITDVSPLKGSTNLERLNLSDNKITDLSPLKGLTNLKELDLEGNPVSEDQKAMLKKALPDCDIRF